MGLVRRAVLLLCWFGALALAGPARAVITHSRVTVPTASPTYVTFSLDAPNTIAVAGTTDSTAPGADTVDLRCFYGDGGQSALIQAGVALAADGSFSAPAVGLVNFVGAPECRLRAVPAGVTANRPAFAGPLMVVNLVVTVKVGGGANAGAVYDFRVAGQQLTAGDRYGSIGDCGLARSQLFDNAYGFATLVFACSAWLAPRNLDGAGDTRSEIQIDGWDAYVSTAAGIVFDRSGACPPTCDGSEDNAGFPPLSYGVSQETKNGNLTIHESEGIVRCPLVVPAPPGPAYPPTHANCPTFMPTGVKVQRTITQTGGGHVVWITDAFSSTDAHRHDIDVLYQNGQVLSGAPFTPGDIGYRFPGRASYKAYARGDAIALPNRPGTIYVKNLNADDGDPYTGQGAITYAVAPSQVLFIGPSMSSNDLTMHYTGSVPASGTLSATFVYSSDFTTAAVRADARAAEDKLAPCTVPKLAGKTLAAATTALTHAHCALGKVAKKHSGVVAGGRVISSNPKAGTTGPNGAKVDLTISRG